MTRPTGAQNRPRLFATGVVWIPNRRKDRINQTHVVTVPSGVRQALGWKAGDELTLQVILGEDSGDLIIKNVTETTP